MSIEQEDLEQKFEAQASEPLPWSTIVRLYSAGAIVALCSAFLVDSSGTKSINCLLISWILAIAAIAISQIEAQESESKP